MTHSKTTSFDDVFSKFDKDLEFKKAERKIRPYYDIVKLIVHRRNDLHLSQKDLAEKIGTHQSRISKIESAENDLRISTLIEIAEALDTELNIQFIPFSETGSFEVTAEYNRLASTPDTNFSENSHGYNQFFEGCTVSKEIGAVTYKESSKS